MNHLYYGDNLQILRQEIKDESVDLVYLDPPFNSQGSYNILFKSPTGKGSEAQIQAFEDSWHWNDSAEEAFDSVMKSRNGNIAEMLRALRSFLKENDVMAYLTMMAARLLELHRVLKATGSLYLHCDPTASHYLKLILDAIFGPENFLNEIIWKRTSAHSSAKKFGPVHDIIFLYGRGEKRTWNESFQAYGERYIAKRFKRGGKRPWKDADLTGCGTSNGETGQVWRGFDVTKKGRHWAFQPAELDRLDTQGLIYWPLKVGGWPRFIKYLDESGGVPLQDVWTDIFPINSQAHERLGYPTQKPLVLLERIISASSNPEDVVLDPFCGCGTTIHAAEKLGRPWIGIDITHLAISLIEKRLHEAFPGSQFEIEGTPKDMGGARALFAADAYQFQWWAGSLVDAVPFGGKKKGADGGIDGLIYFKPDGKVTEKAIVSVKGGENVGVPMIRDLVGVVQREKAKIGIFITLAEPTKPMIVEAVKSGYYETEYGKFPKLQILTIQELFDGAQPKLPWIDPTAFERIAREAVDVQTQLGL